MNAFVMFNMEISPITHILQCIRQVVHCAIWNRYSVVFVQQVYFCTSSQPVWMTSGGGGRFKNAYELLKFNIVYELGTLWKYLAYTLKDVYFI